MADIPYELGQQAAQIESLTQDMALVKKDVRWIRETLAEKRGERRVAMYFAATGGGVVGTIITVVCRKLLNI